MLFYILEFIVISLGILLAACWPGLMPSKWGYFLLAPICLLSMLTFHDYFALLFFGSACMWHLLGMKNMWDLYKERKYRAVIITFDDYYQERHQGVLNEILSVIK